MVKCLQRNEIAFSGRVKFIDQTSNSGRHDKEVASSSRVRIPVGMRNATRCKYYCPGGGLDFLVAESKSQGSFKDIPGIIISIMNRERCNKAWGTCRCTRIGPLSNYKRRVIQSDLLTSE